MTFEVAQGIKGTCHQSEFQALRVEGQMKLLKMSSELHSNAMMCPCACTHMQNK